MAAILFLKLGQTYYQASFLSHISFVQIWLKLAAIFEYLEHLYDFQTIGYGGHFGFKGSINGLYVTTTMTIIIIIYLKSLKVYITNR